jgi:rod shape-determining protein MreB and related proteins
MELEMMKDVCYAGIDLGTMHTAVASSTGMRRVIPSMVGLPKDELARSFLQADMIFGHDLEQHRKSLVLHRPFERGTLKYGSAADGDRDRLSQNMEFAKKLLRHAIDQLELPEGTELRCILGVPAQASLQNKQALMEIAGDLGQCVLLVSEPFVLAFSREAAQGQSLIVDVGAGTTDICHYFGAFPEEEDQATIGFGGDHVDLELQRLVLQSHPNALFSLTTARRTKEKFGFLGAAVEPVVIRLPMRDGPPQDIDLTEMLRAACTQLADRVVEGLKRVLASVDYEYQAGVLRNIVLAGGGSQLPGLDKYIEQALADYGMVDVTRIYDPVFGGAQGALDLAMRLPASVWESLRQKASHLGEASRSARAA